MNLDEARAARNRVQRSLEPDTLPNLEIADLQKLYDCLCGARSELVAFEHPLSQIDALLQILRQEKGAKLAAERDERRHKQIMRLVGWTLFWAMIGGIATVGLLLRDIPFSKLPHAITFLTSPASSMPTATVGSTVSPTATKLSSESTLASPTPSETETPIKLPPPAP